MEIEMFVCCSCKEMKLAEPNFNFMITHIYRM